MLSLSLLDWDMVLYSRTGQVRSVKLGLKPFSRSLGMESHFCRKLNNKKMITAMKDHIWLNNICSNIFRNIQRERGKINQLNIIYTSYISMQENTFTCIIKQIFICTSTYLKQFIYIYSNCCCYYCYF